VVILDSFLDWSVVGLPTLVSAVGAWVSMKPPDSKRHPHWRWGLVAFGLVVSALTFWQQHRTRESQIDSQHQLQVTINQTKQTLGDTKRTLDDTRKELQDSRMDSARSTAFLSGQITVLTQLAANPPRNPDVKAAATALQLLASKPVDREETATELRREGLDLARRLRDFETSMPQEEGRLRQAEREQAERLPVTDKEGREKIFSQYVTAMMESSARQRAEFEPLRSETVAFRQKIIRILPSPRLKTEHL
jgi:hypothetical protein